MVPHRARHPLTARSLRAHARASSATRAWGALAFAAALGGCIEFSETPAPGSDADSAQVATATTGAPAAIQFLTPFGPATRPFSPAVRVGGLIFLSGQVGTSADATGGLVPGGIEAETRQTMENIKAVLDSVGSGMDRVVKCTVMMADMTEWDRMNEVYRTYFTEGRYPARSAIGANGLALGARVEIECIAAA
ncbi:MAG TPA: RidA family protein [Gemmatimonadaceae bacterium]|nr:RidA family protein [Gemmatimonadaceae bacterium]